MARLVYVLPYLEFGGTEQHVVNLMRALRERHDVLLAAPDGPLAERVAAEGLARRPFVRFDRNLWAGLTSFRSLLRDLRGQADLIHVHAGLELALLARVWGGRRPVVYTVHGFFGPSAKVDYRSAAWVANRAVDRLICVSHIEREKLLAAGLKDGKATVVWNGVPAPKQPEPARVAAFRAKYGLSGDRVVAGAVGRLEKQKGLEYLIEAARLLAERGLHPQILLVGDGRERDSLARQAAEAGVEVVFTGFLGEAERDAALAAIDVLVMPSLGEALPLALIEAMGAGKPVVATTVGGIPEIVQDGESGFLAPPADAAAFAGRLGTLVADAGLRVGFGEAARRFFAANLTNEAMAAKTEQVYLEVLKARG